MASIWSQSIPRSKKLDQGIQLLKLVTLESFEFILKKIQSRDAFKDSEINNLMEKMKINDMDTRHIIETISYMHKQMSRIILKPTELEKILIEDFSIDKDKASCWVNFWRQDINQNLDIGNLNKLQSISWELNLQVGSTLFRKETVPTATIQFKGSNDDTILRLEEDELVYLYNTLENIQSKLDL